MRILPTTALAALALGLAACGTNETDRALSGGAIGAGAGALVDRPLLGAAIGAGAGALTEAEDVNLGEPLWRR